MSAEPTVPDPKPLFRCSFCLKPQTEVKKLISGPGVLICNECVTLCVSIVATEPTEQPHEILTPGTMASDDLLKMLAGYNKAFDRIDATMQEVVDILRQREVSWTAIGETLGVSRQAAWKRFG